MKKLKVVFISLLIFVLLVFAGCGNSATYDSMFKELKANGTYSAEHKQYNIKLSEDVSYYCYTDSNGIKLSYMDFTPYRIMFFITFDNKTSGEYSWSFTYEDYHLRGTLTASECDANTTSLYYDASRSTDSPNASVNLNLRKLAATCCKMCLIELQEYWIDTNSSLRISDLGFNYFG